MSKNIIAVDLGASSGRVILSQFQAGKIVLSEIHRFKNELVRKHGQDCWDLDGLLCEIKTGIHLVIDQGIVPDSIGIDTWGVDFVLLDKQGQPLGDYVAYRDDRTQGVMELFIADKLSRADIYQITGLQFLSFNTIYQLAALNQQQPEWLADVNRLLFIPDYLNYCLTGVEHCEYSNASTSQLLDCHTKQWSKTLLDLVDAPSTWFLSPSLPNKIIGHYHVAGLDIPVASIASHDTASAVVGTPLQSQSTAFLSSGTWSLMGIERSEPVINALTTRLEITHEGGAEGRFRMLKNIMGLWLVQRLQAEFSEFTFPQLVELASKVPPFRSLIDPDDERFLNPESMSLSIQHFCRNSHQPIPETIAELARCVYDSLALKYQHTFSDLQAVSEEELNSIHIIGGGANNTFLNQLCADVCQVTVQANPTEASSLGNVVGQLIALGELENVNAGREVIRHSFPVDTYTPQPIEQLGRVINTFKQLLKSKPLAIAS
ncbi:MULTISPECIES: rhamnulokinase [Vibrio]|uniref:Rhamnulokinase n=1 Tax=Vibrio casei TaxID=673372 RepID=A0A368LI01_9VIBR|nr:MULTISPECIES: rhamnulokinase [Vibrio]RCS70370.1 rhamnulokinase [Vibrio casei]SJN20365.1 Rhamnulokinase [Vibrio casei]HBV77081.1 rhamnulokinase [Vibrio sp.]